MQTEAYLWRIQRNAIKCLSSFISLDVLSSVCTENRKANNCNEEKWKNLLLLETNLSILDKIDALAKTILENFHITEFELVASSVVSGQP